MDMSEYKLLRYAHGLAIKVDPEYDGWELCGSASFDAFETRYKTYDFPFSHQDYLNNTDIIDTITGYGLDVELFWYALLYVYFETQWRCVGVVDLQPTTRVQLQQAVDYVRRNKDAEMVLQAKGKKKITIYQQSILKLVFDAVDELLKENSDSLDSTALDLKQGKRAYSVSVQICHAANLFVELFHMLKLSEVPIPKEQGTVSYNKLLLISRIIYFMKLTRTKSYLDDENALKAILRDYSEVPIKSFV